jgi:serine/threonine protein phosphatase PrpC
MASDGVWDNLYDKDIENCIKKNMPKNKKSGFWNK